MILKREDGGETHGFARTYSSTEAVGLEPLAPSWFRLRRLRKVEPTPPVLARLRRSELSSDHCQRRAADACPRSMTMAGLLSGWRICE
jgi:hypothetical protein